MRDARDDAGEEAAVVLHAGVFASDRPKRSEFSEKTGPRAHGEDVADDAADAGRRALERLDRARMIVALHLERDGPAVADVDHARVFLARL